MIKLLFALLFFFSGLNQRCLEGCLRCSQDNKCLYCDVLKGYQLSSERCIRPQIPNCQLTNDKFQCLSCEPDFYLDKILNQCIELIQEIRVVNCKTHEGPNKCQVCNTGFCLKNGACEQIPNPIANCVLENDRQICLSCAKDFIRSVDKKSCVAVPKVNNCGTYKWVTCRDCKQNYLKNDNYFMDLLFQFRKKKDLGMIHQTKSNVAQGLADSYKFPTCQKIEVSNCLVQASYNRCQKCVSGYFVNKNFQCEENPKETITNCLRYDSLTSCIACSQGYHLKDQKCIKVFMIENCMIYRNDNQTTVCTRCFDDYFLSAENLCEKRTDQSNIPLCKKLFYNFEQCEECLQGYIQTSDKMRCLGVIKNCQNYEKSNKNSIYLKCALCRDGFFYDVENRICIKGTVDFCQKYDITQDICTQCKPKFYLIDNKCESQKQLKFCQKYHFTQPNTCTSCDQNNFLFSNVQSCQKVDIIPRCEVYGSKTKCQKCKNGYYLKTSAQCLQIPLRENCLQKSGSNCIKCLPNFALLGGRCLKGYDWVNHGCKKNNLNGLTQLADLQCNSCQKNFVPIDAQGTYTCHKVQTLHQVFNMNKDQNFDKDCLQYNIDSQQNYQCVKCVKGRVLVDGQCRENCYIQGKLTVYKQWISLHNRTGFAMQDSIRVDYSNICEKTIPNCAVASLDVNQDFINIKYQCEKCVEGFIPVTDTKNYGMVVKNSQREKHLRVHMPATIGPGVICVDPLTVKMLGDVNKRRQIDFCDYYTQISKDSYGCRKCMHGKTGKIIQIIKQCKVFKNPNECFECEQGYYLQNSNECRPINKIEHCSKYDPKESTSKCIECQSTHFLTTENGKKVCKPRVNSLKKKFCTFHIEQDLCNCNDGFVMHPTTKDCWKKPDFCENVAIVNEVKECSTCDRKKAYLSNTNCLIGTIPYCNRFKLTENDCEECMNGYYLENKLCKAHTTNLDNLCNKWNLTTKDVCNECKPEATKFKKIKHCKEVNEVIENCETYTDIFSCKTCKSGYYLNNVSKRCLKIPPSEHCQKLRVVELKNSDAFDKNDYTDKVRYLYTCDKCEVNYYRRQYSINEKYYVDSSQNTQNFNLFRCVDWLHYHVDNCNDTNTDILGTENFSNFCYGCNQNYLPMSSRDKYVCVNKKYLPDRVHGFTIDSNCKAYEYQTDRTLQCKECIYPYFLDTSNNNCIDGTTTTCTAGSPFVLFLNSTTNKFQKNICATLVNAAVTNCKSYISTFKVDTTGASPVYTKQEVCFECTAGNLPFNLTKSANIQYASILNTYTRELTMEHYDQQFPGIQCEPNTNLQGIKNGNVIENCAMYRADGGTGNNVYCMRCQQGYHGRLFYDTANTSTGIEACEKMTTCDSTLQTGLHLNDPWNKTYVMLINLFSCQKCTDDAKIPIAFIHDIAQLNDPANEIFNVFTTNFLKDNTQKYIEKPLTTAITNDTQPSDSYQIQCWAITKLESTASTDATMLTFNSGAINPRIPTNCALAIVDTNVLQDNIYCVACKEGFRIKTYDGTTAWMVKECEAITPNPASGKALNRSGGCTYLYDDVTDKISADLTANCLAAKTGNCFAGKKNGTVIECNICDTGYELIDKKCKIIKVPRCKSTTFKNNFKDEYNSTHLILQDRLFHYSIISSQLTLPGCTECESSDDILYMNTSNDSYMSETICTQILDTNGTFNSSNHSAESVVTSNPNCLRYGYKDSKYICVECQTGHRMDLDNHQCSTIQTGLMTSLLPNCLIAESGNQTLCKKCKDDTFVNVGGLCRPKTDANYADQNCQTQAEGQKTNYQSICAKCKPTYYAKTTVSPFNKCTKIPASELNCVDYLDETGCVDCAPGYGLVLVKILNSDQNKRICVKLDLDSDTFYDHDPKCEKLTVVSTSDTLNQQRLVCRKCHANSVLTTDFITYKEQCYPVITPISDCVSYDSPDATLDILSTQLQQIKSKDFKCLECSSRTTFYLNRVQNVCTSRTVISDCKQYDLYEDRCTECNQGFLLSVDMKTCNNYKNNKNIGYLDVCREISNCKVETQWEGLNHVLSSLYSCHQCMKSDEIPFSLGTIRLNEKVKGFEELDNVNEIDSNNIPWKTTNIEPQQQVRCLKPVQESFGMTTNFNFPDNCALGFININSLLDNNNTHNASHSIGHTSFDYNNTTIRCQSCKPKYKAVRQSYTMNGKTENLGMLVASCQLIENCENSTWFNGCSQCKAGFAHPFINDATAYDQCVAVPEYHKECWSFETETNRCIYCKKGTYLNKDYVCELINPSNCEPRQFRYNEFYTFNNIQKGLYFTPDFIGCSKCKKGYVGVRVEKPTSICVNSLYHIKSQFISNTLYIQYCTEYTIEHGQLKCLACLENYIISENGQKCQDKSTNLENCQVSSSYNTTHCNICMPGFVQVDRKCVANNIDNCLVYQNDSPACPFCNYHEQICVKCKPEFYLEGNVCLPGKILNCAVQETSKICKQCEENFTLILSKYGKSYCYPNDPRFNCKVFKRDLLQAQVLQCEQCFDSTYILSNSHTDRPETSCMQFKFTQNCLKYDNNLIALGDSTFKCIECEKKFYNSDNQCFLRKVLPNECVKYDIKTDTCTQCQVGYFVSANGLECIPYPQGIQGCEQYLSKNVCIKCLPQHYLNDQGCVKNVTEVPECVYYEDNGYCLECTENHQVFQGSCLLIKAQNCATYESVNHCETCPKNHHKKTENDITSCVPTEIPNCIAVDQTEPFDCVQCQGNLYPNKQECSTVGTLIPDCIEYNGPSVCNRCTPLTVLSHDQASCLKSPEMITHIDLNCNDSMANQNPVCNTCQPGFVFLYGKCIACKTKIGCKVCDAFRRTKCLMCSSGFIMTPEGDCMKPITESSGIDDQARSLQGIDMDDTILRRL